MVSVAATASADEGLYASSSDEALSAKRRRAIVTRLRTEDWTEMARPAYESPNHVSSLERWRKLARAENPNLDDEQLTRLAQHLKDDYYARLSAAAVAARRARAAIDSVEGADGGA